MYSINVVLEGEFKIASLLASDKGTHTSSCVSIADIISYSFETGVLLEYAILMRHVSFVVVYIIESLRYLIPFFFLYKSCEH